MTNWFIVTAISNGNAQLHFNVVTVQGGDFPAFIFKALLCRRQLY